MEDPLVDREQWITIELGTIPMGTSKEDWEKLDQKSQSTIWLCITYLVLLNVSREDTTKKLRDKLGNLY